METHWAFPRAQACYDRRTQSGPLLQPRLTIRDSGHRSTNHDFPREVKTA